MTDDEFDRFLADNPGCKWRQTGGAPFPTKRDKKAKGKEKRHANGPVIRQPKKKPNLTERRFKREYLEPWLREGKIDEIGHHESIILNLANGCDYQTDWPVWKGHKLTIYEVKGAFQWDDAIVKLKVAARQFRRISFFICKFDEGRWRIQRVKP
jgi:hypothetical protein